MIAFHLNQYISHQAFNRNNCLHGVKTYLSWLIGASLPRFQKEANCHRLWKACHTKLSHVSIEVATCFFRYIFKFNYALLCTTSVDQLCKWWKDRHVFFSNFKAFLLWHYPYIHVIVCLVLWPCVNLFESWGFILHFWYYEVALDKTMCIVVVSQFLDD